MFQGRIDRCFSPHRLADACRSRCETQNIAWRFRRATDRQVRRRPNPVPASRFEVKNSKMHDWIPDRCIGARVTSKDVELHIKSKRRMNMRVEHPAGTGITDDRIFRIRYSNPFRITSPREDGISATPQVTLQLGET